MKIFTFIFLILLAGGTSATAQVSGCTDMLATNYNASATVNDGSCVYSAATVNPLSSHDLDSVLKETSGLCFFGNDLLTINDNSDSLLYRINTTNGSTTQVYFFAPIANIDWEDITADDEYIYIGEFGNNVNGNRTDLRIYRIAKTALTMNVPVVDTISFSYSNQTSFAPTGENNTDFDCEAFWVKGDSIYLATKQWLSQKTSIYALPKVPGIHTANLKATLNVGGLITGATFLESGGKQLVALSGYNILLQPFIYLLYDFTDNNFTNGNKRKVSIGLPFHQMEGIATANGLDFYLTNEKFVQQPIANVPQQLHHFDLRNLLEHYITGMTSIEEQAKKPQCLIFPNPASDEVTFRTDLSHLPCNYTIYNGIGQVVLQGKLEAAETRISIRDLAQGQYFFTSGDQFKRHFKIIRR